MYMWVLLRKGVYTSKSVPYLGHIVNHIFLSLFVVVFIPVGNYPYYESLVFIIIKPSQYWWFSLQGFSRGMYTKIFMPICA
jgi:hypothetical protein